jgi:hypothetical protein
LFDSFVYPITQFNNSMVQAMYITANRTIWCHPYVSYYWSTISHTHTHARTHAPPLCTLKLRLNVSFYGCAYWSVSSCSVMYLHILHKSQMHNAYWAWWQSALHVLNGNIYLCGVLYSINQNYTKSNAKNFLVKYPACGTW